MKKTPILLWCSAAALGLGAWAFWGLDIDRHVFPRHWEAVEPGAIYRSGELSTTLVKSTWEKNNIKCVINLIGPEGDDPSNAAAAAVAAQQLGIKQQFFPLIGDGTGDVEQVIGALKALHASKQNNEPVVVHCAAGTYRTGMIIALYRTLFEGWTGEEATKEMIGEGVKPQADRPIFVYLNNNVAQIAQRLMDEGVIAAMPDPLPRFGREL